MGEWFIYQPNGKHIGPVSTELLVRGAQAGKVPRDAHVAAQGSTHWVLLTSVPELAAGLAAPPSSLEPPRTVPPAPAPRTTLPPAALPAPAPLPKVEILASPPAAETKPEPPKPKPVPMRPWIPIGIFAVFVVLSALAFVVGALGVAGGAK